MTLHRKKDKGHESLLVRNRVTVFVLVGKHVESEGEEQPQSRQEQ